MKTIKKLSYIGNAVKPSSIMKHLSAPQRQTLVMKNLKLFKHGKTIPASLLRKWYNIPVLNITELSTSTALKVVRNHDLCMITAYTKLNKILARRGLVIKRQKGIYKIQTLDNTKKQYNSLFRVSNSKALSAVTLVNGYNRYKGNFKQLTRSELLLSE